MSRVLLAPNTQISVNMNLNGEEMNENSTIPLWEDSVTCLNDNKMQHSPSGRSLVEESEQAVEGSWLEDPDSGSLSSELSVRTQALIEGLEIDMSIKNGVNGGVITPTKSKGGDHYHRHKSRLNRKSIDETLPDRQPKKSIDETLPDLVNGAPSPKAVSPAQSPHTVSGGRKGSFRRRRKNSNKHLNFIGGVEDLSDDSDSGGPTVPSSFVKVSIEVLSPTASSPAPSTPSAASSSASGGSVSSVPPTAASPDVTSGVSSKDTVAKTPGASVGSPYLFQHHQTRMQQSPYFRALFGNMSITLDESTSTSEVPTPPTVDETGDDSIGAKRSSKETSPVPGEHDPLRIELFSDDEGGDFGPGSASSEVNDSSAAAVPNVGVPTPEPLKRSTSYENSWPSLPKPSRSKSSSLVASVLSGSPMSPPRSGSSALTPNAKLSPGSRLSGRKSTGKKSLSSDSLRWLRSDKYLSSLLFSSGSKTPEERRSASSGGLLTDSPRRMRFPEPDSILKSPIPFPLAAMELSDTVAVTTPTRYSQMLSPDRHTKLFPMMTSGTPPEPLSPAPPLSPTPAPASLGSNMKFQIPKIDTSKTAVPPSSSSSGGVDPFELSLTPRSPTVSHHHMSYARYLAMTATPKSLSRSNTNDELAAEAAQAEEETNDLIESCLTELDPQAVVKCLYNTFIAEDRNRTHSVGGFPIRSMTNNLNLAGLSSSGGVAAAAMQPRKKSWDDPDTESDEEEESEFDSSVRSSLLSSTPAEEFQDHVRSFGMSCNVPMFERTLRRCSYFKTLPQERIQTVDFMWMFQQIYPTHYVLRKGRELSLENLTGQKVLTSYLSRSYVFHLVSALSHEDDRVTSSRLSVLKMFYLRVPTPKKVGEGVEEPPSLDDEKKHRNGAALPSKQMTEEKQSMKKAIVVAMEHASFCRLERCVDSAKLSAECEVDNNYIAKRGYTADGMFTASSTNSNAQHRDAAVRLGCAIGATTKDSEERPAYKTRDNDNNMMELMKFVIACEIAALESSLEAGSEGSVDFSVDTSMDLLLNLVRVFFNIFRCYGYKLGNSSEHLEQPDLLNSLLECLEGLLLWSHLVSVHLHGRRNSGASIDDATYCEPFYNSLCLLMLSRVSKYWTRHCNFAQEIAFIRVTETLLSVYTPLMSMPEAVTTALSPSTLSLLIPSSSSEGIPGKCLRKLLCSLTSPHFKVSLQAIQSIQSGSVLSKYILPAIRPDQFVSVSEEPVTHEDLSEVVKKRPRDNSSSSSSNSKSDGAVAATSTMKNVGLTVDDREAGLIVLVDRLRQNRTHWHPVVQQSSTLLMNMVYDRLQEIEDAQECEQEDTCSDSYDPEDGNFL